MESTEEKDISLMDREKQKEEVKPFRKYEITAIALIFMLIIVCYHIYTSHKELENSNSEFIVLSEELDRLIANYSELKEEYNQIEVNYISLYHLDKELNIDILRNEEELKDISEAIDPGGSVQYRVCYKASLEGDKPETFRKNCGGLSPLLVLIETSDGYRFAGYTSESFDRKGEEKRFIKDETAFIYSFNAKKKYKVIINEKAIGDFAGGFPQFGEFDIYLANDGFLNNTHSKINFPKSYEGEKSELGDNILNGGIKKFKVKEVEILICFIN